MSKKKIKSTIRLFRGEVLVACADSSFITKLLFVLLVISIPMLLDSYISFILTNNMGIYFILGIEATSGFIGLFLIRNSIIYVSSHLIDKTSSGKTPEKEFASIIIHMIAAVFIITPGFASDALGVLLLFPGIKTLVSKAIIRVYKQELRKATEYLAAIISTKQTKTD